MGTYVRLPDGRIFHFTGEHVREMSTRVWRNRQSLAAFAGRPITLGVMEPLQFLAFVKDHELISLPGCPG